jgi:hypothetical protein
LNLDDLSKNTLAEIKKAATTGMLTATGLQGIDLSGVIQNIPVPASFYNSLAKTRPDIAGPYAIWRVMTNINNQQLNPATAFDYSAPLHKNNMITVSSAYAKLGYGYTVTKDSVALAKGFADAHALEVFATMSQYKIGTDRMSLGGQNFALATPAAPTVTTATGTSTGSIATGVVVNVKVAARTGTNYYYGTGSTAGSAAGTVTTGAGSANTATAKVAYVPGAVAYDWFVANGAGTYYYYTTTIVNQVTITSMPTVNQAVPTLPNLSTVAPTSVPVTDSTAQAAEFNGLLATLAGDYATGGGNGLVSRGSGTNSGASFTSLDGAGFTGSGQNINELDALNDTIFQNTYLSPDAYMCSSKDAAAISKLLLSGSGTGTTFFTPGLEGRTDVTAGGFVGHYVNKSAGGIPIRIEVHPNMVPGTLIARTDRVNFPNAGYSNVFELRNLDDLTDYQYGVARNAGVAGGGPRWDGEVYSTSTLINRAPAAQAVLSNIAS